MDRIKLQPHSASAEQCVLGCCILDENALLEVIEVLDDARYFYNIRHQRIYRAILDLANESKPVDVISVRNQLVKCNRMEMKEQKDLMIYVVGLMNVMPTTANAKNWAEIVKEKYTRRELIKLGINLYEDGYDEKNTTQDLLLKVDREVYRITNIERKDEPKVISTAISEMKTMLSPDKSLKRKLALNSGYSNLDNLVSGFCSDELYILAGRPAMGKTAFSLNLIQNYYQNGGELPILFFSLEMSTDSLVKRLISQISGIDGMRVKNECFSDNDRSKVLTTFNEMYNWQLFIDDGAMQTPLQIKTKSTRIKKNHGLGAVVIDYMQLITHNKAENRTYAIGETCRQLKALSKELKVPVLCLSQLSREVDKRPNKRPRLTDLRESGNLEQEADMVMFIYREAVYNDKMIDSDKTEIIIRKSRHGPTGTAYLDFDKQSMRFRENNMY